MAHGKHELHVGKFEPSNLISMLVLAMIALGAVGTAVAIYFNPARGWAGYLMGYFFVSCLSLGGLFWLAINHLSKAGWSVSIRRIAESLTSFIPVILIGGILILVGAKHLYLWLDPAYVAAQPLVSAKTPYLNIPFMAIRMGIFAIGVWMFRGLIVGHSLQQDKDGDESHTVKNVAISIAYILFFALAFSFFTVDLLMSLLPTWYSTIFGIYAFAGMFQSTMAFLILLLMYIKNMGFVKGYYTTDHIHDVAKYMKGFTIFWAYIAFSQFMLIWYANIPEETEFYLIRAQNGWTSISVALIIGKFIVPFLALLPRGWKRSEGHLLIVCLWILAMNFMDVFWLVGPNFNDNHLAFGFYEIAPLVGFLGIFLLCIGRFLKKHPMVALKDPRMDEALAHHVTY